ncbi:MAG: diguanylate cyclase [Gammaproteobacteria bacterium]|nr:diguanylate cyclase [Gammaproteobacteria bacterium]
MNGASSNAPSLPSDTPAADEAECDCEVEVNLAPAEVLIVDDDAGTLERLRFFAEEAGYRVRTARNGDEALKRLQEQFCALLVTDILMPGMSGRALCETIRSSRYPSYIYTIALSGRDGAEDVIEALDAGADDFISKRATRGEWLARLQTGRRLVGLEQALRQAIAENRKLIHLDALTGCFNRHYLVAALDHEIGRCRQHGHWLSILHCDVDGFRQINAARGYGIGNELLQELASRIKHALAHERAAWTAYYGADEFVVVMPESSVERACASAETLARDLVLRPLACSAGLIELTLSIGVCGVTPGSSALTLTAGSLLDAAEDCTRRARASGGHTFRASGLQHAGVPSVRPPVACDH